MYYNCLRAAVSVTTTSHNTNYRRLIYANGALAALIFLASTSSLIAASIAKVELKTDGSDKPPGDLLRVTVVSHPNETQLRLETKAYLAHGSLGRGRYRPAARLLVDSVTASVV
jgi:hypothetical protein